MSCRSNIRKSVRDRERERDRDDDDDDMLKSGESMRPRFHRERDISRPGQEGREREGSRAEQIVPFVRVRGVSQSVSQSLSEEGGEGIRDIENTFLHPIQRMAIVSVPPLLLPSLLSLYTSSSLPLGSVK